MLSARTWIAVVTIGVLSASTLAEPRKPPRSGKKASVDVPASPRLDLRKMMDRAAFEKAGLGKLEETEIDALNEWLTQWSVTLLQAKAGGCQPPIEASIDGEFEGWSGDTVFKLNNGQIWKQSNYSYTYSYAYSPSVVIFKSGGSCKLKVDGVSEEITVERLK